MKQFLNDHLIDFDIAAALVGFAVCTSILASAGLFLWYLDCLLLS